MLRSWPLVVALLLANCTSNGVLGGDTAEPAPEELEGTWILADGQSPEGDDPLKAGDTPVMDISEDGVDGAAACNDYHYREWAFDGSDFSVAEPMWTAMLCEDDYMDGERAFKDSLEASEAAELTNNQLRLMGGGGQLVFDRDDPVE